MTRPVEDDFPIEPCAKCGTSVEVLPAEMGLLPVEVATRANHSPLVCALRAENERLRGEVADTESGRRFAMEYGHEVERLRAEVAKLTRVAEAARDVREDLNRFLDRGLEVPPEMVENCEHVLDSALAALDGGSDG
jgi:hypothetical protein